MTPRLLLLLPLLLLSQLLIAQFESDYTPLQFSGTIPDAFLPDTKADTRRELDKATNSNLSRREQKEFYTITNYALKQAFQSGAVLFNDSLSQYVQKVAQQALSGDPELAEKVNVYVTRFTEPNASAWRDGTIFINVGLLARLETEAQLAFVICHEAVHVRNKHVLRGYEKKTSIQKEDRKKGVSFSKIDDLAEIDQLVRLLHHKKSYEFEADAQGFEVFQKSGYKLNAAVEVMDVLSAINQGAPDSLVYWSAQDNKNTNQQGSDTLAQTAIFANIGFNWKGSSDCEEVNRKKDIPNDDDELTTHPSTEERQDILRTLAQNSPLVLNGKDFFFLSDQFQYFQTLAAFEIVERYMYFNNYSACLYRALELSNHFPENQFIHECIARSLYWLAYYDKLGDLKNILPQKSSVAEPAYAYLICFIDNVATDDRLVDLASTYTSFYQEVYSENDVFAFLSLRIQELEGGTPDYQAFINQFPESQYRAYIR